MYAIRSYYASERQAKIDRVGPSHRVEQARERVARVERRRARLVTENRRIFIRQILDEDRDTTSYNFV